MSVKNRLEKDKKKIEKKNEEKIKDENRKEDNNIEKKNEINKSEQNKNKKKESEPSLISLTLGIILCYITLFVVKKYFMDPAKLKKKVIEESKITLDNISTTSVSSIETKRVNSFLSNANEEGLFLDKWTSLPDYDSVIELDTGSSLPIWGSYRPGYYIGMKTRAVYNKEEKVIESARGAGFSWFTSDFSQNLRDKTNQDELESFEWLRHDGKNYGEQSIKDGKLSLNINNQFISLYNNREAYGGLTWSMQIRAEKKLSNQISYLFTFGSDCSDETVKDKCFDDNNFDHIEVISQGENQYKVIGHSKLSGYFLLQYIIKESEENEVSTTFSSNKGLFLSKTASDTFNDLKQKKIKDKVSFLSNSVTKSSSIFSFLSHSKNDFTLQIDYYENLPFISFADLKSFANNEQLNFNFSEVSKIYIDQFENKFNKLKEFSQDEISTFQINQLKSIVSSLIGGIGQYEGLPRIDFSNTNPLDYLPWEQNGSEKNINSKNNSVRLSLFSASPSRTIFPRGFLWDEGFHQMILSQFDVSLSIKILTDWFNTMFFLSTPSNSSKGIESLIGWIPREIILGDDASSRVPDEFITQKVTIANPPTILIVIDNLLDRFLYTRDKNRSGKKLLLLSNEEQEKFSLFLNNVYPRLHAWVQWFRLSQQNHNDNFPSFRWRGRANDGNQYIPNTLASGLDDYPRGFIATSNEKHLDLYCWMANSYRIMDKITKVLDDLYNTNEIELSQDTLTILPFALGKKQFDSTFESYEKSFINLKKLLVSTHFDKENKSFFDIGFYSDNLPDVEAYVSIICGHESGNKKKEIANNIPKKLLISIQNGEENPAKLCPISAPRPIRLVTDPWGHPQLKMITNHPAPSLDYEKGKGYKFGFIPRIGYNSIYPLLMKLLPLESEELKYLLDSIENESLLMTESYGLRSISKSDIFYNQESALYNEPYWRGQIWLPINYLAVSSLHYYSNISLDNIETSRLNIAKENKKRSDALYNKLRKDLVNNVLNEHQRTGNTWEQYDDMSGKGKRGHPFTGWTATVVNIHFQLFI